ncbi:hypothetical protein HU200_057042 [Digitaria exilis]|uniref:Uncharacterized protein n=1 Tax=Digitaria exilis TaxID=1010633 RepID=A0A835AKK3_9POAL|nr:hypothetical protein HU200_057042 [Digitaria exilis]
MGRWPGVGNPIYLFLVIRLRTANDSFASHFHQTASPPFFSYFLKLSPLPVHISPTHLAGVDWAFGGAADLPSHGLTARWSQSTKKSRSSGRTQAEQRPRQPGKPMNRPQFELPIRDRDSSAGCRIRACSALVRSTPPVLPRRTTRPPPRPSGLGGLTLLPRRSIPGGRRTHHATQTLHRSATTCDERWRPPEPNKLFAGAGAGSGHQSWNEFPIQFIDRFTLNPGPRDHDAAGAPCPGERPPRHALPPQRLAEMMTGGGLLVSDDGRAPLPSRTTPSRPSSPGSERRRRGPLRAHVPDGALPCLTLGFLHQDDAAPPRAGGGLRRRRAAMLRPDGWRRWKAHRSAGPVVDSAGRCRAGPGRTTTAACSSTPAPSRARNGWVPKLCVGNPMRGEIAMLPPLAGADEAGDYAAALSHRPRRPRHATAAAAFFRLLIVYNRRAFTALRSYSTEAKRSWRPKDRKPTPPLSPEHRGRPAWISRSQRRAHAGASHHIATCLEAGNRSAWDTDGWKLISSTLDFVFVTWNHLLRGGKRLLHGEWKRD